MRNKVVHDKNYKLSNPSGFLQQIDQLLIACDPNLYSVDTSTSLIKLRLKGAFNVLLGLVSFVFCMWLGVVLQVGEFGMGLVLVLSFGTLYYCYSKASDNFVLLGQIKRQKKLKIHIIYGKTWGASGDFLRLQG